MTHAHRAWLLTGAIGLASAAPAAQAAEPVNGRIAYTTLTSGAGTQTGDIWTMNPDGSDKLLAVGDPLYDAQPDWAPDGTRIAFRSRRDDRFEVSVIDFRVRDAAGRPVVTDVARPTDNAQSSQPAWFPDMSGIVYRRTQTPAGPTRADLWAMDVDGTNRRPLYVAPEDQWYPSLSPDKTKLLFATSQPPTGRSIHVMDIATGAVRTLFDHSAASFDSAPAWSPDGNRIAFESDLDGDMDIYVMNADGSNVRPLTSNGNWDEGPAWSPDGTRIAFTRAFNPTNFDVWTMAADGTDLQPLTTSPLPEESPDWGRNPGPVTVGGTVPATLALTLPAATTFGTFTPGVARVYTASATATVTSTAGSAALTVSDPGRLANGTYPLPQPLQVAMTPTTWTGPVANAAVAITFTQPIGANDPLRTGTYSRTLTFTLATSDP